MSQRAVRTATNRSPAEDEAKSDIARTATTARNHVDTGMKPPLVRTFVAFLRGTIALLLVGALLWGVAAHGMVDLPENVSFEESSDRFEPEPQPTADGTDAGPAAGDPGETRTDDGAVESETVALAIHERVNELRHERGLEPLDHDAAIANVSRAHGADMHERGYFSHVSPDGETPADRMAAFHPHPCRSVGENLAFVEPAGATDEEAADRIVEQVVSGWLASDGHRENLFRERWDSQGIGVYVAPDETVYATQKFCGR